MDDSTLQAGPITVDTRYRDRASVHGRSIDLTEIEHRLLVTLLRHRGLPLSRAWLHRNVWRRDLTNDSRTVAMHVSRLRVKLGRAGKLIQTVRGVGYRFDYPLPRR